MKGLLITIDGPAGAGKTTVSRSLAKRLGYTYVDTGALYRGVALAASQAGIDATDDRRLGDLCAGLDLKFAQPSRGVRLMLGDEDITDKIRTPDITMLASAVSARPTVRKYLLALQRSLGRQKEAVFEGRDMGTVVFPDADVKFYLDAAEEIRAGRRFEELKCDDRITLAGVRQDICKRDRNDSSRTLAPLKPAADAIRVDSSELTIDQVVALMLDHVDQVKNGRFA